MARLDLSTKAVVEQRGIRRQLGKEFDRFRDAVGKDGCKVLFLSRGINYPVTVSQKGGKKEFLQLDRPIIERAKAIVKEENQKLAEKGVNLPWIDGKKTAVQRVDFVVRGERHIAIRVRKMLYSHILAMKDEPFERINNAGMRKLDTNTHVFANDSKFQVILIAIRGKRLSNARMGEEVLCAPTGENEQLTLTVNGMVDADMLSYPAYEIIERNSLKEFGEELNIHGIGYEAVSLEGIMMDTQLFTGAFGVVTSVEVPLTLKEINKLRMSASDSGEISQLYSVENSAFSIANFLREYRDKCVPQLISGLVIYGYNRYGEDFLKAVTRL